MASIADIAEASNRKLKLINHSTLSTSLRVEVLISNLLTAIHTGQRFEEEDKFDLSFNIENLEKFKPDSMLCYNNDKDFEYFLKGDQLGQHYDDTTNDLGFDDSANDQEISEFSMVSDDVFSSAVDDFVATLEGLEQSGHEEMNPMMGKSKESKRNETITRKLSDHDFEVPDDSRMSNASYDEDSNGFHPDDSIENINDALDKGCFIQGSDRNSILIYVSENTWENESNPSIDIKDDSGVTLSLKVDQSTYATLKSPKKRAHFQDGEDVDHHHDHNPSDQLILLTEKEPSSPKKKLRVNHFF